MTDGHPLVWLVLVLTGCSIAVNTTNPLLLLVMTAGLGATSVLARGPRRSSFVVALGASLLMTSAWVVLTLALPRGSAADALVVLPTWAPGPGVTFGGPIDPDSVISGIVGALRATVVVLLFGLAGQLVSARGWLALSRSTLGPGAPALHPLATLGEATTETLLERRRIRQQGWGRGAAAGWLTSLLLAGRNLARFDRADGTARPLMELARLLILLVLAAGPVLLLALSAMPSLVTDTLFGTDIVALCIILAVVAGLLLPGTPTVLQDWRPSDLPQIVSALLLVTAWVLRDVLGESTALTRADNPLALPWLIAVSFVVLPLAVGLSVQPSQKVVTAHA